MRKLLCIFLIGCTPLLAELPPTVRARLAQVNIASNDVSLWVQGVDEKSPRWSHLPWVARNPASVMKLLVSFAALDLLGPDYTWETSIAADESPRDGVLRGNVYLRGGGDPQLTFERFWLLLYRLRNAGVRSILGDVVIDNSLYTTAPFDPGAFDDQPLRPYNGEVTPLMVNFNALNLQFSPSTTGVTVSSEPDLKTVRIVNNLTVGKGACGALRQSVQVDTSQPGQLLLRGTYPAKCGIQTMLVSPMKGSDYVAALWSSLWSSLGGTLNGQIRPGTTPANALPLVRLTSFPLEQVLRSMNKYSNNQMAQQIFLTFAIRRGTTTATGTEDAARNVLQDWLGRQGVNLTGAVIDNGSGLSRNNRVTAGLLAQLLQKNAANIWQPLITSSIAHNGMASNFLRRLDDDEILANRVFVKSGHLENVRALAGYVLDRQGRWQVVVLLIQSANVGAADSVMKELLRVVATGF